VTGAGISDLVARVARIVQAGQASIRVRVPAGAGKLLAFIGERAEVLERAYEGDVVVMRLRASPRDAAKIEDDLAKLTSKEA